MVKVEEDIKYELTRERSQKKQPHPIPFIKVAGKVRFVRRDVEEWAEKLAAQSGGDLR